MITKFWTWVTNKAYNLAVKYWAYIFVACSMLYLLLKQKSKPAEIQAPIVVPPIRESGPIVEMVNDRIKAIEIESKSLDAEDVAAAFNQRATKP